MSLRTSLNLDFVRMGRVSGPLYDTEAKKLDPLLTFSRASSATRFNSSGVLETVGSGVPRFDFDPVTLQCRGLLMEEARTNYVLNSNDLSGYNTHEASVAAGVASDLGGLAYKLQESAGNSFHYVGINAFAVPTTGPFAVSVYAKMVERRYLQLLFDNTDTTVGAFANFDLQTGAVTHTGSYGGSTVLSASISATKNGWYRCVLVLSGNGAWPWARLGFMSKTGATDGHFSSHVGTSGHGFLLQYPQVEIGSFATSYIPTTGAAATRALELCYANSVVPWINPTHGTIFAEFSINGPDPDGPVAWRVHNTFYAQYNGGVVVTLHSGGAYLTPVSPTPFTFGEPNRLAVRYTPSWCAAVINGGTVVTANHTADTPNALSVGNYGLGDGYPLNGHLRRFTYLPHALSDLTLKALTQ